MIWILTAVAFVLALILGIITKQLWVAVVAGIVLGMAVQIYDKSRKARQQQMIQEEEKRRQKELRKQRRRKYQEGNK
ncbi:MAG: phage holin family protein [Clostridiales bacterium]